MANEFTLNASLAYEDSEEAEAELAVIDLIASITSKKYTKVKFTVGITEEAIPLGEATSPGWALFINRDPTNFIELRVATSGAKFAKLKPNEFAFLRLGSGAQVPYAIADTDVCQMEYLLFNT